VVWDRDTVTPSFFKGLGGKRRESIIVRNRRFRDHVLCIGARSYGSSLDVSWYLLESTRAMIIRILAYVPIIRGILILLRILRILDVFDQEDLRAYVSVCHHATRHGVEDIIERRKLDVNIDWKSKGLFGVS
jgi:hypothetical protein